jgi:2-desacetyl-2-hydroxyethyl bacteriochlorophyllide A dehydrogenase
MRALVYTAPRIVALEQWPNPSVKMGEVEVAVSAAGICGADLTGFLGRSRRRKPPLILGHELVGRTPDGRRVVADPLISCGHCSECVGGRSNLCRNLRLLGMDGTDGCFAEYVVVPREQVYPIPDELDDAQAIFVEPLANVVHLFAKAAIQPNFRVGIVGAGTMGSLALQMAIHMGVQEVLVEEVNETRRAAAEEMGAALAVNPESSDGEVQDSAGPGLDLVIDACGTGEARQQALDLCRPGGTVVLLGLADQRSEIDFATGIRNEIRVLMSFGYTREDFSRSLELLIAGAIDLRPWTVEMALEDGQEAFERMTAARGSTLKTILRA